MRDQLTTNTTIKVRGNGWCLPITKLEKDILGIEDGDDLEITIKVMERKSRE